MKKEKQLKEWLKTSCIGLLVFFSLVLFSDACQAFDPLSEPSPVKIKGDSVEYFYKENRAEGRGNISIEYGHWKLTADSVDVNMKTKEAWAKGDVVLTQPGAKYEGDEVHINFETGSAEIANMEATVAPFFRGKSAAVQSVEGDYYILKDSQFTTCEEDQNCADGVPPYRLESAEVEYHPDDKLIMKHVVIKLHNTPIFYLPVMVIPIVDELDQFPLQVAFGKNSQWGAFALTKYRYYLNDDHDGVILNDIRENQGYAWGVEHFYRMNTLGQGALRTYFADDECGAEDEECSRSKSYVSDESSRYRVQVRHRAEPLPDTGVNFELNKLSDEFMLQDFFFRNEFERIAFPDNYLSIVHAKDEYTVSALARYRLDDFIGVVERMPEIRFDTHTKPIGDSSFYFRSENQGAWLNQTHAHLEDDEKNEEAGRIDSRNRLSYVFKVAEWAVTPFVGSRHTFYTRDLEGDDDYFIRNNVESGVDVSSKYFKVYDTNTNAWGMHIQKMRHIFTPSISYFYQSRPTHVQESLIQFDRIDSLNRENTLTLDFENKLQIKYKDENDPEEVDWSKRTLVRSIVQAEIDMTRGNQSRLDEIRAEIQFMPYDWLTFDAETTYRFETDEFDSANVDIWASHGEFKFGVGQRYINGESNQTTIQAEWQVHPEWKLGVYERFDFAKNATDETGRNNEFELSVEKRNFFCWTLQVTYNRSHRENSVFFTLSPTTFSNTSFRHDQRYHPPNSSRDIVSQGV